MAESITLTATSDYTTAGKQFIGLVTGPDRKFGCALEFVGTRFGSRDAGTRVTVVEPGLYKTRDTTRKRVDDTYVLVWRFNFRLIKTIIEEDQALRLAKGLSAAAIETLGRVVETQDLEDAIKQSDGKDPEEVIDVRSSTAEELGVGTRIPRRELVAARQRMLDDLRGVKTPERPIEIDALPSDPTHRRSKLEADRQAALDHLANIDLQLRTLNEGR